MFLLATEWNLFAVSVYLVLFCALSLRCPETWENVQPYMRRLDFPMSFPCTINTPDIFQQYRVSGPTIP